MERASTCRGARAKDIGEQLGSQRWEVFKKSERIGIRMRGEKMLPRGI